jgi:type III pantothenate kinase
MRSEQVWLALMIGNSRLHWASFNGLTLQDTWDTSHLSQWEKCDNNSLNSQENNELETQPLVIASVVSEQTKLWQNYPNVRIINLDEIPLRGLYSTLGIDRALAVLGAGTRLGWPVLVIDAGTALTLTGCDRDRNLIGGAILPGLNLQLLSLKERTSALPLIELPESLPRRWAMDTPTAIQSGVIYTILAGLRYFIVHWQRRFPDSKIVFTGGDRALLLNYFKSAFPELGESIIETSYIIFWGMSEVFSRIN